MSEGFIYTNKSNSVVLSNVCSSNSSGDWDPVPYTTTTGDSINITSPIWKTVPAPAPALGVPSAPFLGGQPSPYSSGSTEVDYHKLFKKRFESDEFATKYKDIKDFLQNSTANERAVFLKDVIDALKQLEMFKNSDLSSQGFLTKEGLLSLLICLEGDASQALRELNKAEVDEIGKVSKIEISEKDGKVKFK